MVEKIKRVEERMVELINEELINYFNKAKDISQKSRMPISENFTASRFFASRQKDILTNTDEEQKEKIKLIIEKINAMNFSEIDELSFEDFIENYRNLFLQTMRAVEKKAEEIKKEKEYENAKKLKLQEKEHENNLHEMVESALTYFDRQNKPMSKPIFEYTATKIADGFFSESVSETKLSKLLNGYAAEGWRVISMVPMNILDGAAWSNSPKQEIIITFEREII